MPNCLWTPLNPKDTEMDNFRAHVNYKYSLELRDYQSLWEWSVDKIQDFWLAVWEYTNIIYSKRHAIVLEQKPMDQIPKWFLGARLNYAENLLAFRDDRIALISTTESGVTKSITYAELYEKVSLCSGAMRQAGIKVGDRIAAYIPNCIEAVVAMLATTSIGAIWSSASPDFGSTAVLERFTQINPVILFSINAVVYNGRTHEHLSKLTQVISSLPSLKKVVVISYIDIPFQISKIDKAELWDNFLTKGSGDEIEFEQLPFDQPAFILYSSGTTGKPKCIVHSSGGCLLQHKKEHVIHGSMKRDDIFFYYTTTGWMMWNWLVSGLSVGSTLVLYDGSPFKPDFYILWRLVDLHKITIFGTSAKYLQTMQEQKLDPISKFKLSSLKAIYSTGSPLMPESFDYIQKHIQSQVLIGSITGGTDIISLFAGHNTSLPVYRGEIQCRCLGMNVQAWDTRGKSVFDQPGDLVCTKPFPCMPVYFWNDENMTKYKSSYFGAYPGIWYHGDYLSISSTTGGVVMLGRSDGTLKPGGVRFGTAEIYNLLNEFQEIADSVVVGQNIGSDERVILFCKMKTGKLTEDLKSRIRLKISTEISPRVVPSIILEVPDIPYTITGKKVEIAVKKIISGEKLVPSSTLVNPESLRFFYDIAELRHKHKL